MSVVKVGYFALRLNGYCFVWDWYSILTLERRSEHATFVYSRHVIRCSHVSWFKLASVHEGLSIIGLQHATVLKVKLAIIPHLRRIVALSTILPQIIVVDKLVFELLKLQEFDVFLLVKGVLLSISWLNGRVLALDRWYQQRKEVCLHRLRFSLHHILSHDDWSFLFSIAVVQSHYVMWRNRAFLLKKLLFNHFIDLAFFT